MDPIDKVIELVYVYKLPFGHCLNLSFGNLFIDFLITLKHLLVVVLY